MVSRDVLSQDEINALLEGVRQGEVDTQERQDVDYERYDLSNQGTVTRSKFPALDLICERFVRDFRSGVYNLLRKTADVQASGTRVVRLRELAETFYVPSSFTLVRLNPLRGMGLIVMEPTLVFRIVDVLFGGIGRKYSPVDEREYTKTEVRIINLFVEAMLADLREAWKAVEAINFRVVGHESNMQMAQICEPNEMVIAKSYSVQTDNMGGDFHIVLPYSSLEPIRYKLEQPSAGEEERDERWSIQMREEVRNAHVELLCRLGEVRMTLRDVIRLREGDVIPIDEPDALSVFVEGVHVLNGRLGTSRRNMAVQIENFVGLQQASEPAPSRAVALLNHLGKPSLSKLEY